MATSLDFAEYIQEKLSGAGEIRIKKMFGEYGIYCNEQYFAVICDNQLLIKITEAGKKVIPNCPTAPPYDGAKPMFLIEDLENRELLEKLTLVTCENLPKK